MTDFLIYNLRLIGIKARQPIVRCANCASITQGAREIQRRWSVADVTRLGASRLDFDEDLVFYHQGVPFNGISFDDTPGVARSEIEYKNGLQDGWSRDWYSSGLLKEESLHRKGLKDGPLNEYGEDRRLRFEAVYEFGVLVWSKNYAADGSVAEEYQIDESSPQYLRLRERKYRSRE
jgi:hypothetical protein